MKDAIIPPIPTPFIDGKLSCEKLRCNIEKLLPMGVAGVLALGSNGESVFLSDDERCRVMETARAALPPGKILVAGTGLESTTQTIELTNQAAGLGADYALVGPPHYFKSAMTPAVLYDHYAAIADASDIPILPYNSPGFTGFNMGPELIGNLARHPNIPGVKDGTGNIAQLAQFRRDCGDDFLIFSGNAPTFLAALFVGINGGMMPIANCFPDSWIKLASLFRSGQLAEARKLESVLLAMTRSVMKYGPGGIKAAMDLGGFFGGKPILPLQPPSSAELEEIRLALKKAEAGLQ